MRFLVDASLPRSSAARFRLQGHDATDVRDLGMGSSPDEDIAALAKAQQLCLITRDFDFADVRNYPPADYFGIVVIDLPNQTTAPAILQRLDDLLAQPSVLVSFVGRLAIVQPSRIRVRPAP